MKNTLKYILTVAAVILVAASCSKFLNRPAEDRYTTANYYQNDMQVEQSVNYLYNSPWYDIIRFYIYGSETMCGNVYQGNNAYSTLTVNGTDADLKNMSYSLWAVNAQCNTVINNIRNANTTASEATNNKAIGEALAWKAMAYFLLVRTFGDVPIIHDNTSTIKDASYNEQFKVKKSDVYDYIIITLEKAIELLPKDPNIGKYNRIDKYAAMGLLAKVYLTKAGVNGSISSEEAKADLEKAKTYALDVIENSGRSLTPNYEDVFRMEPTIFQATGENLFSWQWISGTGIWTAQNSIQSDVSMQGIDEFGNTWGDWKGPSVNLQDLFGVSADVEPTLRVDKDDRRHGTIMMFGDQYPQYWRDKGGLDLYRFHNEATIGVWQITETEDELVKLAATPTDEMEEISFIKSESLRKQRLAVRALLNTLFDEKVYLSHHDNGKPYLENNPTNISITHTEKYVAVILHEDQDCGIDVESLDRDFSAVEKKALSEDEIDDLPDEKRNEQLAIYWCAKEAIFKLLSLYSVDFAEQIEVDRFRYRGEGELEATFVDKDDDEQEFNLEYMTFDRHVLVWVVGD